MSKIDLHIHSHYSNDGEFSIGEILRMCAAQKMELVSITDHNSIQGTREALKTQGLASLPRVISGVELDCVHQGRNFHVLGYGFDPANNEFTTIGHTITIQEQKAAAQKIALFEKAAGIPLDSTKIIAASKNGVVTGELIAEHVLAAENAADYHILKPYLPGGEKSDMPYVHIYWDFFSPGKAADVPVHYISMSEAIALIHRAGGIAVLAHPGQNLSGSQELLDSIIALGIDGIEVFSSYHSVEEAAFFLSAARQNKLLVSCGSDFHGKTKPLIPLGGHKANLDDSELRTLFRAE